MLEGKKKSIPTNLATHAYFHASLKYAFISFEINVVKRIPSARLLDSTSLGKSGAAESMSTTGEHRSVKASNP